MEDDGKRKVHRPKQAGAKYNKRKEADKAQRHENDKGHKDPRAFGVSKIGRARKAVQRKVDIGHRKAHAPLVDRRPDVEAPPIVVVVMGPPRSGKTTLIKVNHPWALADSLSPCTRAAPPDSSARSRSSRGSRSTR